MECMFGLFVWNTYAGIAFPSSCMDYLYAYGFGIRNPLRNTHMERLPADTYTEYMCSNKTAIRNRYTEYSCGTHARNTNMTYICGAFIRYTITCVS